MLVFIVPLRSPQASKDWSLISKLTCRCLGSLLNQTDSGFIILLVCNVPPIGIPSHANLRVLQREFPIPTTSEERIYDKWRKMCAGMVAARSLAPCHIMIVDSDDCVNRKLAGWVAAHPKENGWTFSKGYIHDEGARLIYYRHKNFNAICGTSTILNVGPDDLPVSPEQKPGENPIFRVGHGQIHEQMAALGRPLAELPFAGAIYNTGTGENWSGFSLKGWVSKKVLLQKLFRYRLFTQRLRNEFSYYDLPD